MKFVTVSTSYLVKSSLKSLSFNYFVSFTNNRLSVVCRFFSDGKDATWTAIAGPATERQGNASSFDEGLQDMITMAYSNHAVQPILSSPGSTMCIPRCKIVQFEKEIIKHFVTRCQILRQNAVIRF